MITAILSIFGNLIWAIFAFIFICGTHEERIQRLSSPVFICCSLKCFYTWMFVVTGLNVGFGILNAITYFSAGSDYVPFGITLIVLITISAVHALIFRAYITKYKETYNI